MTGILWLFLAIAILAPGAWGSEGGRPSIEVFAGSISRPALTDAARLFEELTGAKVLLHFGGSGAVLSQMELTRRGDVYAPGSSDFMEVAKRRGLVDPSSEVRIAYLLPAINVPKKNPKQIRSLEDLARPGLRLGMARPDTVCVGLYGVEVLERQGLSEKVKPNIVSCAESCEKTAQMLSLGLVDAILGWDIFEKWDPLRIATVHLGPGQVARIGYVPAAAAVSSRAPKLAALFVGFLESPEGKAVFERHGYVTDLSKARLRAGPDAPVGGEFALPKAWQ